MPTHFWTDDQIEEAYLYWAADGKQSFKETAEYTAIPERTLYLWAKRDNWRTRRADDLRDAAGPAVETFRLELKLLLSAATLRLGTIISRSKDEAIVLKAIGMLAALTLDPTQTVEGSDRKVMSLSEARLVSQPDTQPTRDELLAISSRTLEANMQETRARRGRTS